MREDLNVLHHIDPKGYFEGLAKASSDIISLVDPKNFTLQYINHIKAGFTLEEVIGADVFNFVYPEHAAPYRKVLNEVVSMLESRELELETEDRIDDLGKAWYFCSISPILNSDNKIESIIIISKDITASKRQEIEIQNRKEKLYAIINNTNDIITSIDVSFNLTEYNSVFSKMVESGYGKKDLNGTNILNYIDPRKHDHLKNIYKKAFGGEIVNDVESFETATGKILFMETSYHPIYDFNQEITGLSIFSKDITERTLNDKKLKNTLKEREVLLAEIHHRIKNNLALVSSMLQLKEMNLDNELAIEALRDSRKRIKSTALVHEMLYRNETFDNLQLKEFIKELFSNLNVDSTILLDIEGDEHFLELTMALPFGLLMHELMMNSIKHSFKGKENAKLKIRSTVSFDKISIDYCDCSGVFPDTVNFKDTSTTGLMLIHTFIEQLNGSIELVAHEPPAYAIKIPLL